MRLTDIVPACFITSSSSSPQDRENGLDAFLAERRQAPRCRVVRFRRRRAECERLEEVGAATKAAVDDHEERGRERRRRLPADESIVARVLFSARPP